jgi:predicted ATPase/class 3 adenylate cyclase
MSEIKALLLTDVVGSTQLSEELGDDAMVGVWAAHDRAARDLLPQWRGREIDKTDGMLLLFDEAADAVHYALAYQRALQSLATPLQARAGLHCGPVILRENSAADIARGAKPLEVDGLAKPTAARVMSLAHGGQLLLTPDALQAAGDLGAAGLVPCSRGHWVMKGLNEPVEVFEVSEGESTQPALTETDKIYRVVRSGERWLPVREIPNNLPQAMTSFVGRDRELAELKQTLGGTRLVTLLGMGGLGKTRLSLQVAAEVRHLFPDGVWFVDLSPLRDPALVVSETAQVLGLRDEPERTLLQTICSHLRPLRTLFVIDNCEHLRDASAELVDAMLRAVPQIRILTSSRQALDVPGEQLFPVQPLPLPARGADVAALGRSTAVRLFVDRARAQRPEFAIDEQEAGPLAELVSRLEGIPLAIELAAARVRHLDLTEINEGLEHRYQLLTGGSRRLQARQQTLRALVDWSYELLDDAEQTTLQRLGVFVGGIDLAAAKAVCGAAPLDPRRVVELLESLADKSLLSAERRPRMRRWKMLDTIRDYALDKLDESGEGAAARARHCGYFFTFAKQGREGMQGREQGVWLDRLDSEHDNLRAAIDNAQAEDSGVDPFVAVKMAVALQNFWIMRGHLAEGRAVVEAQLARPVIRDSEMAHAHSLYVGAALAWVQSDLDAALHMLERCLALRRGLGDPSETAATLSTLAVTRLASGDADAALEADAEALQTFREIGYRVGEAISQLQLGQIEAWRGRPAEAHAHLDASLALAREIGHPETEGEAELALGELAFTAGDAALAEQRFKRSLAVCEGAGDRRGGANARWALARVDLAQERLDAAREGLRVALQVFHTFEMRGAWLGCLDDHVALALLRGDRALAVGLASTAQRLRDNAGLPRSPDGELRWQTLAARLLDGAAAETHHAALQAATAWDSAEAQRQADRVTAA